MPGITSAALIYFGPFLRASKGSHVSVHESCAPLYAARTIVLEKQIRASRTRGVRRTALYAHVRTVREIIPHAPPRSRERQEYYVRYSEFVVEQVRPAGILNIVGGFQLLETRHGPEHDKWSMMS